MRTNIRTFSRVIEVSLLIFLFLFYSLPASGFECPEGSQMIRKIEEGNIVKIYCKCSDGRMLVDNRCVDKDTAINDIDERIRDLEKRTEHTRDALNFYRTELPKLAKSIEEWGNVAKKARKDAFIKAANLATTIFLTDKMIRINEQESATIEELRKVEVFLNSSNMRGEVEVLRKIQSKKELLRYLNYLKKGVKINSVYEDYEDREKFFENLASVIYVVTKDPRIKLSLAGGEYGIAVIYANVAGEVSSDRIEQLLDLSEQQLRAVKSLSEIYRKDINNLKNLKEKKRSLEKE